MIFPLKKAKFFGTTEPIQRSYLAYVSQDFNGMIINYPAIEGKLSHGAWDVGTDFREPLYAIADFKTLYARRQYSGQDDIGNLIILNHPKEKLQSWYRHMDEIIIPEGGTGKEGDLIGYCDTTGKYCYGTHLHFELKQIDDMGQVINVNNGWKGSIDPANYYMKIIADELRLLYNAIFGRDPDSDSAGYVGKDLSFVLEEFMKSPEYKADASVLQAIHAFFNVKL